MQIWLKQKEKKKEKRLALISALALSKYGNLGITVVV